MKKEIGKWFMDIAKYVATAVLISSFLGSFQQKWAVYLGGSIIVVIGIASFLFEYQLKASFASWQPALLLHLDGRTLRISAPLSPASQRPR